MKTDIQNVSACRVKLAIEATAEEIDPIYKGVRSAYTAQVSMPGFRKGKTPWEKIEAMYGKNIQNEINERIIQDLITKGREEAKVKVAAIVDVENLKSAKGEGASVTFVLDIVPEVKMPDIKKWQVKKLDETIDEQEIENRLTDVRRMAATFNEITDDSVAVAENDLVAIAFTSDLNKDDLSDAAKHYASDDEYWTQLREDAFIPGLKAQVIGKKLNESASFSATFDKDFKVADLAGKTVNYTVTIKKIRQMQPADDAAVLKRFEMKSMDELKERLMDNLKSTKHYQEESRAMEELTAAIDKSISFDLPEHVLDGRIYDELSSDPAKPLENFQGDAEALKKTDAYKAATERATKSLRRQYLLSAYAEANSIKLTSTEVDEAFNQLASATNMKVKELVRRLQDNGRMEDFLTRQLGAKVLTELLKTCATL